MRKNLGEMDNAFFKEAIEGSLTGRALDLFRCALEVTNGSPWDGTQSGSECADDLFEALFAEVDPSNTSEASIRGKKWLLRVKLDKLRKNRMVPNRMPVAGNIIMPPPGLANQHLIHQATICRPNAASYVSTIHQQPISNTYSDSGRSATPTSPSSLITYDHTAGPGPHVGLQMWRLLVVVWLTVLTNFNMTLSCFNPDNQDVKPNVS
jgi:hypothetical protein